MTILSLDIGKKGAYIIYETEKKEFLCKEIYSFDSFVDFFGLLEKLNTQYAFDFIIIGEAFGRPKVVKKHSKFYGVAELFTEMNDKIVVYVSDMTARSVVLGKGFGHNKKAVHEKYQEATSDLSDSRLFLDWYLLSHKI